MEYRSGSTACDNQEIQLFRVAELDSDCRFSSTGKFESCRIELNGISTQTQWNTVTETLASHITSDSVTPDYLAITDTDGRAVFHNLPTGLYLVREVRITENTTVKVFHDFIVCLPNSGANGDWLYDVTATPKYEEYTTSPETITYRVTVYWDDKGFTDKRPKSVKVNLFRKGIRVRTVILKPSNNWTYSWTVPDDGAVWQVSDTHIPQYTLTTETRTRHFILEYHIIGKSDDKPDDPSEPWISPPRTGDNFNAMVAVVPMTISGMLLIIMGILSRKRAQEDE